MIVVKLNHNIEEFTFNNVFVKKNKEYAFSDSESLQLLISNKRLVYIRKVNDFTIIHGKAKVKRKTSSNQKNKKPLH